jgi:hypothetical protein
VQQPERPGVSSGTIANPELAFALCYVAAHLVLDLVDERTAAEIMGHCEERFDGPGSASQPPVS